MKHTLVAAFATLTDANRTRADLMARGIAREQVHAVGADSADIHAYDEPYSTNDQSQVDPAHHENKVANFFASLFGDKAHGEHQHHAKAYSDAVRRGSLVIAVDVHDEDQLVRARDALEYNGAIDINERGGNGADIAASDGYAGPTSPYAGATGGDTHLDKHFVDSRAGVAGEGHHSSESERAGTTASATGAPHTSTAASTEYGDRDTADTGRYDIGSSAKRAGTGYPDTTATAEPTGGGTVGHSSHVGTHHAAQTIDYDQEPCRDRICMIQRSS